MITTGMTLGRVVRTFNVPRSSLMDNDTKVL